MAVHLMREIEKLKKLVLSLSAHVEENVRLAATAVQERDTDMARLVIEKEREIDKSEVDVEEECLKILALYQPVAHDLRYIVAILKINHDLERISDLAVTVAERALAMAELPMVKVDIDLMEMAGRVREILSMSLDALINRDAQLARKSWFADDDVDRMNEQHFEKMEKHILNAPEDLPLLQNMLSVSRALERLADHATNIAKDVIYLIEGEIVRHRKKAIRAQDKAQSGSDHPE